MKIVVAVRTLNESENIVKFCQSYAWADKILVADGGSVDGTQTLANEFPNVSIRDFETRIQMRGGFSRNPHGAHLNFLVDWAFKEEGADWIIMDDADCFPNYLVKQESLNFLKYTSLKYVYITRLYLYKDKGHFPSLACPDSQNYVPSLWAWHRSSGLRFKEGSEENHQQLSFIPDEREILRLFPPYALLHCPWQTSDMIFKKLIYYRNSGEVPDMQHPLEFGGELEPLPEWARL